MLRGARLWLDASVVLTLVANRRASSPLTGCAGCSSSAIKRSYYRSVATISNSVTVGRGDISGGLVRCSSGASGCDPQLCEALRKPSLALLRPIGPGNRAKQRWACAGGGGAHHSAAVHFVPPRSPPMLSVPPIVRDDSAGALDLVFALVCVSCRAPELHMFRRVRGAQGTCRS